ncbi:hypothetical protein [Candidatus Methylobacter favarea]|uniref:hypothetical protein n=1 Tax=Candidatus Methylobacter favarea TaxID=2707345 RepID=UPI00157C2704|nr:hypothetical protein [Candidatus Methylobacter favarea]
MAGTIKLRPPGLAALKPGGLGPLPQPGRLGRCRVNLSLCAWCTGGVASGDWDKTLGGLPALQETRRVPVMAYCR